MLWRPCSVLEDSSLTTDKGWAPGAEEKQQEWEGVEQGDR